MNSWEGQGQYAETHVDASGNVAFYWEWQRFKPDGIALQRLAWYEAAGQGRSVHADYQPTGHIVLAPQGSGPYEIHVSFRQMRVHALVDGEWIQPADVGFQIDEHQGDMWWSVRFDWEGGPYFLSTMEADPEEGEFAVWRGSGWMGNVAGVPVIVDYHSGGVQQMGPDFDAFTRRIDPCALEAR